MEVLINSHAVHFAVKLDSLETNEASVVRTRVPETGADRSISVRAERQELMDALFARMARDKVAGAFVVYRGA